MSAVVSVNPFQPDDVIARAEQTTRNEIEERVGSAATAQRTWRHARTAERSAAISAFADAVAGNASELADLACREVGKPIVEARGEVDRVVAIARYYSQATLYPVGDVLPAPRPGLHFTTRAPRGTIAAITPWNFPLAIPMWKSIPALAYGNAVVLKPSSEAIGCALRLAELLHDVLPADLFHVVIGGRAVAEALIDSDAIAAVTFTGSTDVGRSVAARVAARGRPAQCEMGGQNPSIVLPDADLEQAATTIAGAAMGYAGQKCTATSRVIVDRSVADRFVPMLIDAVRTLPVGDPRDPGTVVGPLINRAALDGACAAVGESAAELLTGDGKPAADGLVMTPVLARVDDHADPLNRDEVFAPVAAVQVTDGFDAALRAANATRYGLVASVFTHDLRFVNAAVDQLDVGLLRINAPTSGVDYFAPFGGSKDSSLGPREQGLAAADFFTETKTVLVTEA